MTEINFNYRLNSDRLFRLNKGLEPDFAQKEVSILEKDGGIDTVSLNKNSSAEKFEDVFKEFDRNVHDSTSTIEEKSLAIKYIDRMLACDDIPDDLKIYWQNKKEIIQMEIQNINNEQKTGSAEKVSDVWNEFTNFINNFFESLDDKLSNDDKRENRLTYYRTYISFCNRLLSCTDITSEQKAEYYQMISSAYSDIAVLYK